MKNLFDSRHVSKLRRILVICATAFTFVFLVPRTFAEETLSTTNAIRTGVFPFFAFARQYDVWEYLPMDQGGREIQLMLIGSERDDDIVKAFRRPGFFSTWGSPLHWDSLEKTEPEKSVWLNRWYFLPSLAREYFLTGERSSLGEMLAFMRKWRDENPVPADLKEYFATRRENWRDMQVAWRMQVLAWCYFLGENGYTAGEKSELYEMIKVHAHILLADFGDQPLIENNHQSHAASAMLYAALLFPDLPDAAALKTRAFEILNHHLDKAFYDDGNSVELVPGYYPFFASIFRDSYLLCRANHVAPPPRTEERLRQFYNFIGLVKQPDDTMPPINDSTESSAVAPLQSLAQVLNLPYPYPSANSHRFQASHQAVMRDTNSSVPAYVFLDAGPQVYAHWHGGKLGFHLWFWDKPLVIDSGISDYDDPLRRAWYWNPESHNTILVDGKGDYYKATTKMTQRPMAGSSIEQWESNEKYDWAVMRHTGFENLKDPVGWTRHFILLKGIGALVVDQLASSGEHDYTWLFHLTPCAPKVDETNKTVFTGFAEKNLWLQPSSPGDFSGFKMTEGTINKSGKNVSDPVANYTRHGKSLVQAFFMGPVQGTKAPQTQVSQTGAGNNIAIEVSGDSGSAKVIIRQEEPFIAGKYSLLLQP